MPEERRCLAAGAPGGVQDGDFCLKVFSQKATALCASCPSAVLAGLRVQAGRQRTAWQVHGLGQSCCVPNRICKLSAPTGLLLSVPFLPPRVCGIPGCLLPTVQCWAEGLPPIGTAPGPSEWGPEKGAASSAHMINLCTNECTCHTHVYSPTAHLHIHAHHTTHPVRVCTHDLGACWFIVQTPCL